MQHDLRLKVTVIPSSAGYSSSTPMLVNASNFLNKDNHMIMKDAKKDRKHGGLKHSKTTKAAKQSTFGSGGPT